MALQKTAERYSFSQLLSTNSLNIEIPIIQRDYAQGRDSQQELRTNFLGALYKYLEEGIPNRDLDFVYGYVTKDKDFIPLDGQQRLTTLFLLHWYLAKANNDDEFIKNVLSEDGKSKFIYKTRFSSTDFCEALLSNEINLTELKESDNGRKNSLSKTIINKGWFQKFWISDATVLSILNMLDDIHYLFRDTPHFYKGLISEQPIITFLFLNLDDLKQGDDLYIKMNSRGKPLTNFENFKAKFEQEITTLYGDSNNEYSLLMSDTIIECSTQKYFSYKIDCVWTDLFWNYRDLVGDLNTYDDELMNFIRASLTFSHIKNNSFDKSVLDLLLGSQLISFNKQKELNLFTKDSINFLISTFDTLMNGNLKPVNKVDDNFYFDFGIVFNNILKNAASIPERILYYSYVSYLIKYPDEIIGLQDWMRVISNLVENTRFDSSEQFYTAILSVNKLLDKASTILEELSRGLKVDFFFADQVYEEQMKSHVILSDRGTQESWEELIYEAEKAVFHKGQIGYLFEFSGAQNLSELKENSIITKETFRQYLQKFKALFSILESDRNRGFLLERALLTFGNYLLQNSNWRYNFSSSKRVANYDRDFSWKRILRVDFTNSEPSKISKSKRLLFKELVDSNQFDYGNETLVDKSINEMIKKSSVSDWRKDFIDDPRIISVCGQGYIYSWEYNHQAIQLLNASQMNHLRYDLNTLVLYYQIVDNEIFGPFENCQIQPAKGYDEPTVIVLSNWCHKNIHYKIIIELWGDGKYYLTFAKAKGVNNPDKYGSDINTLMHKLGYSWQEYGYEKSSTSRSGILNKLKELLNELSSL